MKNVKSARLRWGLLANSNRVSKHHARLERSWDNSGAYTLLRHGKRVCIFVLIFRAPCEGDHYILRIFISRSTLCAILCRYGLEREMDWVIDRYTGQVKLHSDLHAGCSHSDPSAVACHDAPLCNVDVERAHGVDVPEQVLTVDDSTALHGWSRFPRVHL